MERFLFRVAYHQAADPDDPFSVASVAYEPVCVRAADDDEAAARAEVETATERFRAAVGATRTLTLVTVTADV